MSYDVALARIAQLQSLFAAPAVAPPVATPSTSSSTAFSTALQNAGTSTLTGTTAAAQQPASSAGQAIVNLVQQEIGVAEQPPGSNDAPRIAEYRTSTAGAGVGPWCAYFVSWLARGAGVALGDMGQGFGSVDELAAWAQRSGRWMPGTSMPQPGDLIVWDEHIGVVEAVAPDGTVSTIEGNSSDAVTRRTHPAGSALGYVRV
jgi:hypothetical protein